MNFLSVVIIIMTSILVSSSNKAKKKNTSNDNMRTQMDDAFNLGSSKGSRVQAPITFQSKNESHSQVPKQSQSQAMNHKTKSKGTLGYGQRMELGDPVPQGGQAKTCGYCGAENLISYGKTNGLKCYFCHEVL